MINFIALDKTAYKRSRFDYMSQFEGTKYAD